MGADDGLGASTAPPRISAALAEEIAAQMSVGALALELLFVVAVEPLLEDFEDELLQAPRARASAMSEMGPSERRRFMTVLSVSPHGSGRPSVATITPDAGAFHGSIGGNPIVYETGVPVRVWSVLAGRASARTSITDSAPGFISAPWAHTA